MGTKWSWSVPNNLRLVERNNQVCLKVSLGRTFSSVAKKYGLTKQRVEQIWQKYSTALQRQNRAAVLSPGMSVGEAAKQAGISDSSFRGILKRIGINPSRGGPNLALYLAEHVEAVQIYRSRYKKCRDCGAPREGFRAGRCKDCIKKRNKEKHNRLIAEGPIRESPPGSMPFFAKRVLERVSPTTDWVTFPEAMALLNGKVSKMQLAWLRRRRILASRPTGIRGPFGWPQNVYSLNQVMALAEALEKGEQS